MGACLAASPTNVEVVCIILADQNHCAGAEGDAIIRICGDVVNQLVNVVIGFFGGLGLLLD